MSPFASHQIAHNAFTAGANGPPEALSAVRRALGGFAALREPLRVVRLVDALVDLGLRQEERQPTIADRLLGDDAFPDVVPLRDVVHHLEERLLDDRAQGPGAGLALEGDVGRRYERARREDELDLVETEELLELTRDRVLRLGQDPDEILG